MSEQGIFEIPSWILALESEGYSSNTVRAYRLGMRSFTDWLAEQDPELGPDEITRDHVRGWLVHVRDSRSTSSARGWFAGVRHYFRWALAEGELQADPTQGIRTPPAGETLTSVLGIDDIQALLSACNGKTLVDRRDAAIIHLFADSGIRLSELAGLARTDVDLTDRLVIVRGKATKRSGARLRAVPIGLRTSRALDRYLRERRKHPRAEDDAFWLGGRNRGPLTPEAIKKMLQRRGAQAGIPNLHPHRFRHTMAHQWLADGGSEGDLMRIGGWRSRQMLDRYGASVAATRAHEAHRRHGLGDKL